MTLELQPPFVGNDLVDLDDPRSPGRSADERFLRRILNEVEREQVREVLRVEGSPAADRRVWHLWAAKEAAYKVASKEVTVPEKDRMSAHGEAPPVFEHATFQVNWDAAEGRGSVVWMDRRFAVRAFRSADEGPSGGRIIHLVALASDADRDPVWRSVRTGALQIEGRGNPSAPFTEAENEALHSTASRWVRAGARRAAAERLGVAEARLEIVPRIEGPKGRTPPCLLLDGKPAPLDVSLSHHGRWVGWALVGG